MDPLTAQEAVSMSPFIPAQAASCRYAQVTPGFLVTTSRAIATASSNLPAMACAAARPILMLNVNGSSGLSIMARSDRACAASGSPEYMPTQPKRDHAYLRQQEAKVAAHPAGYQGKLAAFSIQGTRRSASYVPSAGLRWSQPKRLVDGRWRHIWR